MSPIHHWLFFHCIYDPPFDEACDIIEEIKFQDQVKKSHHEIYISQIIQSTQMKISKNHQSSKSNFMASTAACSCIPDDSIFANKSRRTTTNSDTRRNQLIKHALRHLKQHLIIVQYTI